MSRPAAEPPRERIVGLDVLRGIAALSVLAFHYTTRFGMIFGHPTAPWFYVSWGQRGVELFFVLSGFAIELSLQSRPSTRDFLVSRAARLYPTFWAALAVTLAVVGVFGLPDRAVSLHDAFVNLTMIPTSLGAMPADGVYWTLERELRFYGLVLVLMAVGLRRYTIHALLFAVGVQTIGVLFPRAVPHLVSDMLNGGWAHLFACGALLARLRRDPSWLTWALFALCVASGRVLGYPQFIYGAGAAALVWAASRPFAQAKVRALVRLGEISYPLYLVHENVGYVVMRSFYSHGAPPSVAILSATVVSLIAATALHFAVEVPSLALVKRWRTGSVSTAREGAGHPESSFGAE